MCGIAGVLRLDGAPADEAVAARMGAALAHRGPDGAGTAALGPVALAHRRLAILDLSPRGAQPMALPEAGLTLVHNGEVYDYLEHRAALEQAGERFASDTDTEVVLRAYARWGLDAFARLDGMWALALWDAPRRRLVLARDRFGEKPLYWAELEGALYFASEPKAILAVRPEARDLDPATLGRFLAHGQQDEGEATFFRAIRQLAPGRVLALELGAGPADAGGLRRAERAIWRHDPEGARARFDYARPADALREVLDRAVARRLRSDVPVGTCLSGGLDSSTIVGLAARRTPRAMHAFTAVYDDPGHDERRYARDVAARWGCVVHEVRPAPGRDLVGLLDRIGWFHDEPCARPGLVTQWHVMEAARGHVTVLLDGQGGDELLCGYSAHALPYLRSLAARAWAHPHDDALRLKLLRDAAGLLGARSTSVAGDRTLAGHLARAALGRVRRAGARDPLVSPALARAAGEGGVRVAPVPPGTSPIDRVLLDDLLHRSIPALLHHEDRASMAFGLEARVPFLAPEVVDFCLGLDLAEKVDGARTKAVLRRAARDLLPPSVLARTDKLGYPTPIGRWLLESRAEVKERLLFDFAERGHVPARTVERTWARFEADPARGEPWLLYRWLTTELWLARMVDRPPAPPGHAPA